MLYVYIGLAGALGAISRYSLGLLLFPTSSFPFGTLFINIVGCYLLATLLSRSRKIPESMKTAIGTGFLGSFTTFSTLSLETVKLVESGQEAMAFLYIMFSVLGGIVASKLGWRDEEC